MTPVLKRGGVMNIPHGWKGEKLKTCRWARSTINSPQRGREIRQLPEMEKVGGHRNKSAKEGDVCSVQKEQELKGRTLMKT